MGVVILVLFLMQQMYLKEAWSYINLNIRK